MIDFSNSRFVKLAGVDPATLRPQVEHLLVDGEQLMIAAKGARDFVVFSNKRIIVANVQGVTGKKVDYTSLPLKGIQAFSIEGTGTFDRDAELDMWFSGLGHVRLEFAGSFDLAYVARLIGWAILPGAEPVTT
jgi:hypothetical protein